MRLMTAAEYREMLATEFPSEDALKKYLKEHPKADPHRHTVKKPSGSGAKDKGKAPKTRIDKMLGGDKQWKDVYELSPPFVYTSAQQASSNPGIKKMVGKIETLMNYRTPSSVMGNAEWLLQQAANRAPKKEATRDERKALARVKNIWFATILATKGKLPDGYKPHIITYP